jgi:hypothetical protein
VKHTVFTPCCGDEIEITDAQLEEEGTLQCRHSDCGALLDISNRDGRPHLRVVDPPTPGDLAAAALGI